MAGPKPDFLNAALGAAFGSIASPLVDSIIKGVQFARQCPKECRALAEALDRIQPSLQSIAACYKDPKMEKWLNAFGKCVEEALAVVQKCSVDNFNTLDALKTIYYNSEVLALHDRIKELNNEAPLLLLTAGSSSCGITQEVPGVIFGMDDYFKRVKSSILEGHSREGSRCVGIRGTGGAGKTLLAQMVNNDKEIQEVFGNDFVIWISVGRDASISKIYERMRKRLNVGDFGGSLEDQRTDLMNAFDRVGALLILDDVWDCCVYESKEMVYWLDIAKGSKCVTLITTRDEGVTRQCVDGGEEIILRLSQEESWKLFCTHAFGIATPTLNAELEGMARAVCGECGRLPLALKVIGCAMKGQSDWKRMLGRLQASTKHNKSIEGQLFGRLEVSYEALDAPTRICFLYFAAFPEDYEVEVEKLCRLWALDGLFGESLGDEEALEEANYAMKELVRRSLIEVCQDDDSEESERVKMHDILRDLAIRLVNEDIETERECLFMIGKDHVDFPPTWLDGEMKVKRMSLRGGTIKRFHDVEFFAPKLKICILTSWIGESIGSDMQDCNIKEKFFKELHALRYLKICGNVSELPESMGGLGSLRHLHLSKCRALKELPKSMGGLGSLQHLNLSHCYALEHLPESMGELGSLQDLNLSYCRALKQLPESMGGLVSLLHLDLFDCSALKKLPESMGGLGSLQHLDLAYCLALEVLPESMGGLGSLQHLNLSFCIVLKQLPDSMGGLGSLQHLYLSFCYALEHLPKSMGGLGSLQHLNLSYCHALKQLPESMGGLGSLQHLNLSDCYALEHLPESMGELGSLQDLNLSYCSALKKLPESMGGLGSLQHLDLSHCEALEVLPESMGGLGSLQHLDLSHCEALKVLPKSMGGLGSLQHLDLSHCQALEVLPESMGGLGSLQHLDLSRCSALNQLPKEMGGLGSLQHLDLRMCNLGSLPNFSLLKRLQILI